ncbi:hypothetical protein ACNIZQ_29615, partial [Pseudomonas alloputida]|uniref:hypothetical protein n=1 Tax=Pseudomonas alloputida TaxID=1940621 RepID=UPI003A871792
MQLISLTGVLPASASSRACPLRKPEGKGNACTVARRSGFTREEAGPAGQSPTRRSPLPQPPYSRVNPL